MTYISLVPIGLADHAYLAALGRYVSDTFHLQTRTDALEISLQDAFDPNRKQYNSSLLLKQLIASPPREAEKILGVVDVDLFIPILTFVFGEAQLKGIGSVVSLHRLHSQFYGLPEDRELTTERLVKEAIHELGHTFGLIHCSQPQCVMNSSTYVENIDQKPAELCPLCQRSIRTDRGTSPGDGFRFPWWGRKQ